MQILNGLRIKSKLGLLLALSALAVIAVIGLGALLIHDKIYVDREGQTKQLVEVALGIVQNWHAKEASGLLTESAAQAGAIAALRDLRYGNGEYFFIQRNDGVPLLNPVLPEVEGKPRMNAVDQDGVPRVRLQIEAAKRGGGFVSYRMPRAGTTKMLPKLSYVTGFEPWQWTIGTGVYIDDLGRDFRRILFKLVLIALGIFTIASVFAYLVNRNISTSLVELKMKMEKLAAGDLDVDIDEAERRDEIGEMGKTMRVFKVNAIAAQQLHIEQERRRQLEMAVTHAARLDGLGRLAGGIAHDLNNALVPVLALTKTAMSQLSSDSRERANLELVHLGAQRAKDLVQQILAFSRKQEIEYREFDLALVLIDGIKMLRASLPATIKLESTLDPVPAIHGDPGQLNQVLVNLVTNGAHAIGDDTGTVTIALHQQDATCIQLSVSDTGCGIDEPTKARIFEPFFTTKEIGKGTGLGLSVVHGIVTAHGGTITVHSRRGRGTRFDVVLPIAQRREADAA